MADNRMGLSYITDIPEGTVGPDGMGTGASINGATTTDSSAAQVEALLQRLEMSQAPAAPTRQKSVSPLLRILGAIGDALTTAGMVRAGGSPPSVGKFQETVQRRAQEARRDQEDYQKRKDEVDAANRTLRNTVRTGAFEEKARRKRELELASVRASNRPLRFIPSTIDVDGVSTRVVDAYDALSGEFVGRSNQGPAGYADYIQPAVPGVSPPTRISRQGAEGPIASGVTPPPPPGTSKDISTALNMRVLYKDALASFSNYVAKTGRMKRTITSVGRRLPGVGSVVEETMLSFSDPEGVDVARKIDNLADILLRLRSGAAINEDEYQRLRSLLPKLGENPTTAMGNFSRFETELLTTLRVARARAPAFFTPDLLQSLGLSEADLGGPASRGQDAGTTTTPTVDEILKKIDEERSLANPAP